MRIDEIKLGRAYRDILSGISGYAVGFMETMNGNKQVEIRPFPTKESIQEGKMLDGYYIDTQTLVDAQYAPLVSTEPQVLNDIQVGDRVEDIATGIIGTATARIISLNGCIGFNVPVKNLQTDIFESYYVDQVRLVVVKRMETPLKTTTKVNGCNPGGLSSIARRKEV
jgi:hypothetical protein